MKTLSVLAGFALASSLGVVGAPAVAAESDFPSRPVTLIIPFPPGGATDVLGRVIGARLGKELGQPVVIDNRAGAGTIIGADLRGQGRARRLHAAGELGHHLHRQPGDPQQPALRPGQGLRSDRHRRAAPR